ncbi:LysR family transcriptional regulator [Pseudomonas asiatica]|uniref:LysR family transcriptional regulator n=1 Tax=Pseudomonas asiatica TaxID=2219225 RepID=UPI002570E05C|nr:LysR family transcriptional regulator [Pseudomonas asiatica]WJD67822.1 LysR family transcriptional regulator [Pseudomonas asiatica]
MNIKKMQHVLALAEHLNFSRACADVHLSQPALSRSIQSIEAELGVNLFDRGGAKVALTPYGKVFVERSKRIVFEANELVRDIALAQKEEGTGELCWSGPYWRGVVSATDFEPFYEFDSRGLRQHQAR